jgi:hypothetical protein
MGAFCTKVDYYIVVSSGFACAYEIRQEEGKMLYLTGLDKTDLLRIYEKTILEGLACDVSIANQIRRCVVFIHMKKIMAIPFISLNGKKLVTVAEHDEHQPSTVHTLSKAFDASEPSMSLGSLAAQMKRAIGGSQRIEGMVGDVFAECLNVNSSSTSSSTATAVAPSAALSAVAPSAALSTVAPSTATDDVAPSTATDDVAPSAKMLQEFSKKAPSFARMFDMVYTFGTENHVFLARAVPTNQNWICQGQCVTTLPFGKCCSVCKSNGFATPLSHQSCEYGGNCTKFTTTCTRVHFLTPDQFFKALKNAKISVDEL